MSPPPFWRAPLPSLLAEIRGGAAGLSSAEAATRLRDVGPNQLAAHKERAVVLQLLARFRNPLVLLLLVASGISAATGDVASFGIITFMVLLSVVLDFVQEFRAGRAAERLKDSVALEVDALRDGQRRKLPARELVPGDVVLLAAGDLVPADGRLLQARDFFVNQALMTGEAYPVEKHAVELDAARPEAGLAEAANAVFMGTSVVSGTAEVVVVRTGSRTALGEIGTSLQARPPATSFEIGARSFGLLIVRLATLMVLFVILVNLFRGRPGLESFLFAVALAVGLTPELLPMVISVTLARGALRMSSHKVIVKRLAAIHDLGSMDVLCTDKTGTLTEARIRLERHIDMQGRDSARVLELAYVNSLFESGIKSPLDEAILRHEEVDARAWTKIDEVPFDFERRRVSVLGEHAGTQAAAHAGGQPGEHAGAGAGEQPGAHPGTAAGAPAGAATGAGRFLVVKGALEDVARLSTSYEGDGPDDLRPLDDAARTLLGERFEALGREGFRVLGIAWKREAPDCRHAVVGDETELVFAGFAAFEDPPKASAAPALRAMAAAGVAVKVVTGDNEHVTRHVCTELGLPVEGVLTGADLATLDDTALAARAAGVTLFCRVNPAQKSRVILALKRRGHVVGYLGDGINDAPSLHTADVGISVDGAVDVAKESADLILLAPDLGVLLDGVLEGRRTFGNIMKYIMMGTSSNFGNMFSMAGASLVLPFLPMLPTQILLNNFLYDLSEVPIPMDRVDDDFIRRPRRWDMKFIRRFMLTLGPVSSAFDFLTFFVMLHLFNAGARLFHTGWFVESLCTQVLVIFVIRTRGNPLRSRPSRLLALTSAAVVAVALLLPFTSLGARLGFVAPPPIFFAVLGAMVATYLAAAQFVKGWFYRRAAWNPLPG